MTRRVQAECPDAWDAWVAGQIDHDGCVRINRALRRLVHDSSKQLLNSLVVQVAVGQTPELLGRWLNQFIARVEPEEQDERLRRSMEDRYASVRPDVDGMSFLSALMSAVDAAAIDRILAALAAAAPPGDTRTMAQRRSDALVDMLCGRISNGCHVRWDANDDRDDHLDNTDDDDAPGHTAQPRRATQLRGHLAVAGCAATRTPAARRSRITPENGSANRAARLRGATCSWTTPGYKSRRSRVRRQRLGRRGLGLAGRGVPERIRAVGIGGPTRTPMAAEAGAGPEMAPGGSRRAPVGIGPWCWC